MVETLVSADGAQGRGGAGRGGAGRGGTGSGLGSSGGGVCTKELPAARSDAAGQALTQAGSDYLRQATS